MHSTLIAVKLSVNAKILSVNALIVSPASLRTANTAYHVFSISVRLWSNVACDRPQEVIQPNLWLIAEICHQQNFPAFRSPHHCILA